MSEDERIVRHHLRPAPSEAEEALERLLSSTRAAGYARARDQAAKLADDERRHGCDPYTRCTCDWESRLDSLPSDIRAMQDGMEEQTCVACGCAEHDGRACLNVREFPGFRLRECRCVGGQRP